jgi:hypothetical protein
MGRGKESGCGAGVAIAGFAGVGKEPDFVIAVYCWSYMLVECEIWALNTAEALILSLIFDFAGIWRGCAHQPCKSSIQS